MASCFEYELLISEQLDSELSATEEELLNQHLQTCVDCRTLYQDLTQLQKTLSSFSASPPPYLHDRIMDQIKKESMDSVLPKPSTKCRPFIFQWVAAAALVLVVGGAVLTTHLNLFSPENTTMGADESYSLTNETKSLAPEATTTTEAETPLFAATADEGQDCSQENTDTQRLMEKSIPQEKGIPESQDTLERSTLSPSQTQTESEEMGASSPLTTTEDSTEQTGETFLASSLPEGISYEDAEALLYEYLSKEQSTVSTIIYQGLSPDGAYYLFVYTDDAGMNWIYSVALSDGTIQRESTPETIVP